MLKDPKAIDSAPNLEQFAEMFTEYAEVYNNTSHSAEGMENKSPAEVMVTRISQRQISKNVLDMLLCVWSRELKVGKNGIQFRNIRYGQYNQELYMHFGKKVRVTYNPDDLSTVTVYDAATMKRICIAEQNKMVAYGHRVSEDDIREGQRKQSAATKAMRAYRKIAQIAYTNVTDLSLKSAARKQRPQPESKQRILRPVQTVFDDQVLEHKRDLKQQEIKKVVGIESIKNESLYFDFDMLKPKQKMIDLKIFEELRDDR